MILYIEHVKNYNMVKRGEIFMEISVIKKNAREALANKWGKGALMIFIYALILFVEGLIKGIFEDESIIANIISIFTTIINVPLSFGITYSFIKLKRGEEIKSYDFVNSGFSNFKKAWKIVIRVVLKMIVPIILLWISTAMFMVTLTQFSIRLLADNMLNESVYTLLVLGGVIIVIDCWLAARALLYSLTTYIAFDNPEMTELEIVNESAKMMKGNRLKLLLFLLSFIGWGVLCIFTLGIGYLWLIAYMQVAGACFYESLLENKNNIEENGPIIEK